MAKAFSICTNRSCRAEVDGYVAKCPTCGARSLTSRRQRIGGWVTIFCGVVLVGMMGAISYYVVPLFRAAPGNAGPGFTGTAEQARTIIGLFAAIAIFGLWSIVSGSAMVVTGRRNMAIVAVMLILLGVILYYVWRVTEIMPASS